MKIQRFFITHCFVLVVMLIWQRNAFADSCLTVFPAGIGSFTVQGNLQDKISALDITVEYDAGTLSNPAARCGSLAAGAHCDINTVTSGLVHILINSPTPLTGLGTLASLSFTPQGEELGTINSLDARLTDCNGALVSTQVNVINPTPETSGLKVPKVIKDKQPAPSQPESFSAEGTMHADAAPATIIEDTGSSIKLPSTNGLSFHRIKSILERFRDRPDSASLASLLHLFERVPGDEINQVPSVVLSDGKSTLLLTIKLADSNNRNPIFVLSGGHCVSLQKRTGNDWSMEVLPHKDVYTATLTVLTDTTATEYPMIVAPPLVPARKEIGPSDFAHWRQGYSILHDTAGSARPDYVEDYIYAANYLAIKTPEKSD